MGQETIDEILKRKQAEKAAAAIPETKEVDKFYSILLGEGLHENFLELQIKDGTRICFPYNDIIWILYDPAEGLGIDFGGYLVTLEGRGLVPRLMDGIKQRRVAWIKEADLDLQDHSGNETYISKITVTPPQGVSEEAEPA